MHRNLVILLLCTVLYNCGFSPHVDATFLQQGAVAPRAYLPLVNRASANTVLFYADFDEPSLNENQWTHCYWWGIDGCTNEGNNELQWYQPENLIVEDGILHVRALEEAVIGSNGHRYDYTSGIITSGRDTSDLEQFPRFAFQYGYVEIRAQVPRGAGLWPAFWLLPLAQVSKPEIDIMEILGDETDIVHVGMHFIDASGEAQRPNADCRGADFADGWHTFAVDWRPDLIEWIIDGETCFRYTDTRYIPHEPMYILANLAVGGDWPGAPTPETTFPSDFLIDWIKVTGNREQIRLEAIADAYVDGEQPALNFGLQPVLRVDSEPELRTFLKFDASALADRRLAAAALRIHTQDESGDGSEGDQSVWLGADSTWRELGLTFRNQPDLGATPLGVLRTTDQGTRYEIYLDKDELESSLGEIITLAITADTEDGLYLHARESGSNPPELVLTFDD